MFLPMVTGQLSQVMLRCAQSHQQSQLLASDIHGDGSATWLSLVPAGEARARWQKTIEEDEAKLKRQAAAMAAAGDSSSSSAAAPSLYRPLSNSYLSGSTGSKKRAGATALPATATSAASSSATSASPSPSAPSGVDTRIDDQLARTIHQALVNSGLAPSTTALPADLRQQFGQLVTDDLREAIQATHPADYQPERYPNVEAQIMKKQ